MIEKIFSNCKINLGLFITSKRNDGFHNIETIFYPIKLFDEIYFSDSEKFSISSNSQLVPNNETNLIWKAKKIFEEHFNIPINFNVHINKNIPIFAGLGGGSSNAAFALKYFLKRNNLSIDSDSLIKMALQIGSDVPFFLLNKPCFASGRGEVLQPLENFYIDKKIIIVFPKIKISTALAYQNSVPCESSIDLSGISSWDLFENSKNLIKNDFEKYIFTIYPEMKEIISILNSFGSVYSSLSGSGSALFGLFEKDFDFSQIKDMLVQYEVFLC